MDIFYRVFDFDITNVERSATKSIAVLQRESATSREEDKLVICNAHMYVYFIGIFS